MNKTILVKTVPRYVSLHVTRLSPGKSFLELNFNEVICELHQSKHPHLYISMKVTWADARCLAQWGLSYKFFWQKEGTVPANGSSRLTNSNFQRCNRKVYTSIIKMCVVWGLKLKISMKVYHLKITISLLSQKMSSTMEKWFIFNTKSTGKIEIMEKRWWRTCTY